MIEALHALIYSDDPPATRAFFRDVLQWPYVSEGESGDSGVGGAGTGSDDPADWLIFASGPSEVGVHPTHGFHEGREYASPRHHSVALMCDDLDATVSELRARGAEIVGEPQEMGFGRGLMVPVPGADDLLLYQAHHAVAHGLAGRVASATRTIAAPAATIFGLIADPARQPEWDGNDNLRESAEGQRVYGEGDVFVTFTTKGRERHNHVVEFEEGRRIAWRPSEPDSPAPGHLWRWEVTPVDATTTEVTHTYDWTRLTDERRFERARATTSERLRASLDRLAEVAERA